MGEEENNKQKKWEKGADLLGGGWQEYNCEENEVQYLDAKYDVDKI